MSLEISVRLSSKRQAIGLPFEDLYRQYVQKEQLPIDALEEFYGEVEFSAQNADSGHERQRIQQLKSLLEPYIQERKRIKTKTRFSQYQEQDEEVYNDIFNPGDFVLFIRDSGANDGSLISAGSEGQIIQKYKTNRGNIVYQVKVDGKQVSTFSENIRMAMKLSTAGEDPSYFDSSTDCPSGPQISVGGDTVRTHSPLSLHEEKNPRDVKWVFDPQSKEWIKVFDRVAKLFTAQVLPTPASVSPFASRLQDLSINYQSNPQGTFNSAVVTDQLNDALLTPTEQREEENKQNEKADEKEQQKSASSDFTNVMDLNRDQIQEDDEGRFKTNIDIDGPNQSHQIQTKEKADDDVFDWLPSPYDIGEDGNYRVNPGPNFWL